MSEQHLLSVRRKCWLGCFRLSRRETAISWGAACFLQLSWPTRVSPPSVTCLGTVTTLKVHLDSPQTFEMLRVWADQIHSYFKTNFTTDEHSYIIPVATNLNSGNSLLIISEIIQFFHHKTCENQIQFLWLKLLPLGTSCASGTRWWRGGSTWRNPRWGCRSSLSAWS